MGLFDRFKGKSTAEDDAVALGVATGTTTGVWHDDNGEGDDDGASEADAGEGAGDGLVE